MNTASHTTMSRAMGMEGTMAMDSSRMAMGMDMMDMGTNSSVTTTATTRNDTRTKMRCGDLTWADLDQQRDSA